MRSPCVLRNIYCLKDKFLQNRLEFSEKLKYNADRNLNGSPCFSAVIRGCGLWLNEYDVQGKQEEAGCFVKFAEQN